MKDAIVIPAAAVLKTPDGATTVMLVRDGTAHQVAVETGHSRRQTTVQITKGLAGGETIITNGAYALPDNTKVKIAEAAADDSKPKADQPTAVPARARTDAPHELKPSISSACARGTPADDSYWFSRYAKSIIFLVMTLAGSGHLPGVHHPDLGVSRPPTFRGLLSALITA